MKKRILCVLFAICMTLSFTGCAAKDIQVAFDTNKLPWQTATEYEKSVYKIEKYSRKESGKVTVDDELVASGEYTVELFSEDNNASFTQIITFSITYVNGDAAIDKENATEIDNRGLTDTMTSTVKFNSRMVPTEAKKEFIIAKRPEGSIQLEGYSYNMNYETHKAVITRGEQVKTFDIPSETQFDNEQLSGIVRALQATKYSGTASFYLISPFDIFLNDGYSRYTMGITCAESPVGVKLDANLSSDNLYIKDIGNKEGADNEVKPGEDGQYTINCVSVSVNKSDSLAGPPIKFLISDPNLQFTTRDYIENGDVSIITNKLMIEMQYMEYSMTSAREKYRTVYTLNDYKISR